MATFIDELLKEFRLSDYHRPIISVHPAYNLQRQLHFYWRILGESAKSELENDVCTARFGWQRLQSVFL